MAKPSKKSVDDMRLSRFDDPLYLAQFAGQET